MRRMYNARQTISPPNDIDKKMKYESAQMNDRGSNIQLKERALIQFILA